MILARLKFAFAGTELPPSAQRQISALGVAGLCSHAILPPSMEAPAAALVGIAGMYHWGHGVMTWG